jgi:glycopeptide antibiotics resistance protein
MINNGPDYLSKNKSDSQLLSSRVSRHLDRTPVVNGKKYSSELKATYFNFLPVVNGGKLAVILNIKAYEQGLKFGGLILIIFPIIVIFVLGVRNIKRLPIIALFIIGWILYVIPMELRPYFKEDHLVLFWLGIIPNFGCAFALPVIGLNKKSLTISEASHTLLISSFISLAIILAFEVIQLIKGFGTFDWLDILMSILGTIAVNVIFKSFKSKFKPAFLPN